STGAAAELRYYTLLCPPAVNQRLSFGWGSGRLLALRSAGRELFRVRKLWYALRLGSNHLRQRLVNTILIRFPHAAGSHGANDLIVHDNRNTSRHRIGIRRSKVADSTR